MYPIPQKLYSYPYRLLKMSILTLSNIIPTHPSLHFSRNIFLFLIFLKLKLNQDSESSSDSSTKIEIHFSF